MKTFGYKPCDPERRETVDVCQRYRQQSMLFQIDLENDSTKVCCSIRNKPMKKKPCFTRAAPRRKKNNKRH